MKLQLTEQEIYALKQLIEQNDKIETIKYIRELTGMGLKESKDLSDRFFEMPSEIDKLLYDPNAEEDAIEETQHEHENKSHELNENELGFVKKLLQKGQKLQAVKYVKDKLETGLKEAKEYVDTIEDGNIEVAVFDPDTLKETQHEHKDKSYELNAEELKFVEMLLRKSKKLNAIKYVKERLNLGLKEAKELVEFMDIDNPYSSRAEIGFLDREEMLLNDSEINNDRNDELSSFVKNENKIAAKQKLIKKEKQPKYESEPIVFQKSVNRDRNKGNRRRQSNSGCMLMLTFMFIGGLFIVGGIWFL